MDSNGQAPPPQGILTPSNNVAIMYDLTQNHMEATISRKAANSLKQASVQAVCASEVEVINKTNCLRFKTKHTSNNQQLVCTTSINNLGNTNTAPMNIGDYVVVKPNLSTGNKSFGGQGWIADVTKYN